MDFPKYLKEIRGNRSLREMERVTGISHTYLASLESGFDARTGKKRKPTFEALRKLANTLNLSYIELLFLNGYLTELDIKLYKFKCEERLK